MKKSQAFLGASLIFLAINFVYLLYFDNPDYNPDFIFGDFYSFESRILNTDKKLNGHNYIALPRTLANYHGKILIFAPLYPEYQVGDILNIGCKLQKPEKLLAENGQIFHYDKYLAKDKIYALCFRPQVQKTGEYHDWRFYAGKARHYFLNNLNHHLVEPASSLAKALLLGAQREMPQEVRTWFSQVGLSHAIAISGSHMVIIVWLLTIVLLHFGLSRKQSLLFLFLLLFIYLVLINFLASAVRSVVMIMLFMLGPILGRQVMSIYSLLLAADILIALNPYVLLYDIGWQLSFLAVLGLLWYTRFFNKILKFIPRVFQLREIVSATLAAQVFVWPVIIYNFQIFSVIAPLANVLILPLFPALLVLAILLALGVSIASWPLFILFKIMAETAHLLAGLPYSFVIINNFSATYFLISLVFMFLLTYILKPYNHD